MEIPTTWPSLLMYWKGAASVAIVTLSVEEL